MIITAGHSNAVDVDTLRLGDSSTGRIRTDLPMVALWVADEVLLVVEEDDDLGGDIDAEWEEIA